MEDDEGLGRLGVGGGAGGGAAGQSPPLPKSSAPALNSTLSKVGSILSDSPLARLDVTIGITIIFVGSRSGGRLLQLLSPCPLLLSAQSGGYREEAVERQVPRHRCCWAALSLRELQHG